MRCLYPHLLDASAGLSPPWDTACCLAFVTPPSPGSSTSAPPHHHPFSSSPLQNAGAPWGSDQCSLVFLLYDLIHSTFNTSATKWSILLKYKIMSFLCSKHPLASHSTQNKSQSLIKTIKAIYALGSPTLLSLTSPPSHSSTTPSPPIHRASEGSVKQAGPHPHLSSYLQCPWPGCSASRHLHSSLPHFFQFFFF